MGGVAIITHLQAGQAPMAIAPMLFWCDSSNLLWLQRESNNQYLSSVNQQLKKTKMKTTQAITNATRILFRSQ